MGGGGQAVRRGAMRRLRRFQRVESLGATGRDLPGRGLQDRVFALGRGTPFGQVAHPAAGVSGTLRPVGAFRRDRGSPRGANRMLAGQRFAFGTCLGIRRPRRCQRGASGLDRPAQSVQVGQRVPRIASVRKCGVRVVALDGQVLDPCIDGGEPRGDLRCLGAQLLVCRARAFQVLLGIRTAGTGLLLGGHCRLVGRGCGVARLIRGRGFIAGRAQVAPQQ